MNQLRSVIKTGVIIVSLIASPGAALALGYHLYYGQPVGNPDITCDANCTTFVITKDSIINQ